MSNPNDFVIENGVLKKYQGPGGDVVVPEGVTSIGESAFEDCIKLTSVTLPKGLTSIGGWAFYRCSSLTGITLSEGVASIGDSAFKGCDSLTDITLPEGMTRIGNNSFSWSINLRRVVLPKSLMSIGESAFEYCYSLQEITAYSGITELQNTSFSGVDEIKKTSGDVLRRKEKMSAVFKVFYMGDPEDTAYLTVYQPEKSWKNNVQKKVEQNPETVTPAIEMMLSLLQKEEAPDKTMINRVATFAQTFCQYASKDCLSRLLVMLRVWKSPMTKKLEADVRFMECLQEEKLEPAQLHPVEERILAYLKKTPIFDKILDQIPNGVHYRGSEELCAPRVIAFIVSEYVNQYDPNSVKYVSAYQTSVRSYTFSASADETAAELDRSELLCVLSSLSEKNLGQYLLPYGRYADETHVGRILCLMREWDNWSRYAATGRKNIMVARAGLLLNDTRAAMLYFDNLGRLETYAALRGESADSLRDRYLSDIGLDEYAGKAYDLGGQTVTARLQKDLSFLIELPNGKTAKSLPKKGAHPEKYEAANKDFSEMKKNAKKILKNRGKVLFEDFLSGRERPSADWQEAYLKNPLLREAAGLVVWEQGMTTFTLAESGPIDCAEQPYSITAEPIKVAHPIEMPSLEIAAWQKYYTCHRMKQPFQQIWEPAHTPDAISKDRYVGCELPVYQAANRKRDGMDVFGLIDYSEDLGIILEDCSIETTCSVPRFIHGVTDDAVFTLGAFSFDVYSRKTNHIVYLLDKWTVIGKIKKDDVSVVKQLPGFTLAQITEFIAAAQEANATNVLAALLEYSNAHFADFDPMDEFILEW